jgi:hypothetical protein
MNEPLGIRSKMYGRLMPRLGTKSSGVRMVRRDSYRQSLDLLVRKISCRGVGPTFGSLGFITISPKCFMRRRFRFASSRIRASSSGDIAGISPIIVKSSSFMAPSSYALVTLRVNQLRSSTFERRLRRRNPVLGEARRGP